jgi:hypothetical protein
MSLSGKGQRSFFNSSNVPTYGSAPPSTTYVASSNAANKENTTTNNTTTNSATTTSDTNTNKTDVSVAYAKQSNYQLYDDRKRFATAFLCWLIGGFFGLHHFYLRGYNYRFCWIYSITSFISLGTSILFYWFEFDPFTYCCHDLDDSTAHFLRWLFYTAPIATPTLRWLLDVSRLGRLVQRANAPTSLLAILAPLNTFDAYSMSFSGVVFGAHWLYLRPYPGNTWNSDWTEVPSPINKIFWKHGLLYFCINLLTGGGFGIWWLYDLFRMPVHVDALLGRRRNEMHKYRPSALFLVVVGSWLGLHNFYLFGWRSRYAKLYGLSSVTSACIITLYLSTVKILDRGFCASTFHPTNQNISSTPSSSGNSVTFYSNNEYMDQNATWVVTGMQRSDELLLRHSSSSSSFNKTSWWIQSVCWSWRVFFWLQILALLSRLLVDIIRVGLLGLHENLNSDLHDREDTLARRVSYVNTYLLCLPAGIIGTHRIFLYGMTTTTMCYILTAGFFGFGWIYDLLDVPRLIDDQFSAARRALFHAVPTAQNHLLHHAESTTRGGSRRTSYSGPVIPPSSSWRDHLVEGLAQTLQEEASNSNNNNGGQKKNVTNESRGSSFASPTRTSLSSFSSSFSTKMNNPSTDIDQIVIVEGEHDESVGSSLRGSIVGRGRISNIEDVNTSTTTTTSTTTISANNHPTAISTSATTQSRSSSPTNAILPSTTDDSTNRTTTSNKTSDITKNTSSSGSIPITIVTTPQRAIRSESSGNFTASLPPPSTPIHRIVRVQSVKHIHSPTCHPMSESLKATNTLITSGSFNNSGMTSDSRYASSSGGISRRVSRVSGADLNFVNPDDMNRVMSGGSYTVDFNNNVSNDSSAVILNNKGKATKTLSSIWLIEFELIQLGKKIAAGGSGQLFEARYVGTDVAVKELFTALIDSENIEDFKREVNIFLFKKIIVPRKMQLTPSPRRPLTLLLLLLLLLFSFFFLLSSSFIRLLC